MILSDTTDLTYYYDAKTLAIEVCVMSFPVVQITHLAKRVPLVAMNKDNFMFYIPRLSVE